MWVKILVKKLLFNLFSLCSLRRLLWGQFMNCPYSADLFTIKVMINQSLKRFILVKVYHDQGYFILGINRPELKFQVHS